MNKKQKTWLIVILVVLALLYMGQQGTSREVTASRGFWPLLISGALTAVSFIPLLFSQPEQTTSPWVYVIVIVGILLGLKILFKKPKQIIVRQQ